MQELREPGEKATSAAFQWDYHPGWHENDFYRGWPTHHLARRPPGELLIPTRVQIRRFSPRHLRSHRRSKPHHLLLGSTIHGRLWPDT